MSTQTAVLVVGCPRTGTGFMRRCLQRSLRHTFVAKLSEHSRHHPYHSDDGLRWLSTGLQNERLVIVRMRRHPMETVESFLATRCPELCEQTGSLPSYSDEKIVDWITTESRSSRLQREWLANECPWYHTWVGVLYEELEDDHRRQQVAHNIAVAAERSADQQTLLRMLRDFGNPNKAAHRGRLSEGIETASTDEEREWFRERLSLVIEQEGYG